MTLDKIDKHRIICETLHSIYRAKNADYGDSFGETYKELGIVSAVTRISDKTNRLKQLSVNPSKVKDESIRDTLIDLANYAIMTVMELDNK